MNQQSRNVVTTWGRFILLLVVAVLLARGQGRGASDYLFAMFAYSQWLFSILLGGVFLAGSYVLLDRASFFICHSLFSKRLAKHALEEGNRGVYAAFVKHAREFRATSAEGVYSDDIVARARQTALRDQLDGQEYDWGRSWLEFLGTVAPTVGFLGTLVGLISAFQELGMGGKLVNVLEGLALSMTTSVLGGVISLVFLSAAWLLGRARESFDERLEQMIAEAQQSDRLSL